MTMLGRDLAGWLKRNKMHRRDLALALGFRTGRAILYYLGPKAANKPLSRKMRLALAAIEAGIPPLGEK